MGSGDPAVNFFELLSVYQPLLALHAPMVGSDSSLRLDAAYFYVAFFSFLFEFPLKFVDSHPQGLVLTHESGIFDLQRGDFLFGGTALLVFHVDQPFPQKLHLIGKLADLGLVLF